eukprot:m.209501 g.209501  ORF g.209501 m.209501 type:complete len:528 (-) comp26107_c0_seq1:46-1629(-)
MIDTSCRTKQPQSGVPATSAGWVIHALVVEDGNGLAKHYVNGLLIETHAFNLNLPAASTDWVLNIATGPSSKKNLKLELADLLLYDRALSLEELTQLQGYFEIEYFSGLHPGRVDISVAGLPNPTPSLPAAFVPIITQSSSRSSSPSRLADVSELTLATHGLTPLSRTWETTPVDISAQVFAAAALCISQQQFTLGAWRITWSDADTSATITTTTSITAVPSLVSQSSSHSGTTKLWGLELQRPATIGANFILKVEAVYTSTITDANLAQQALPPQFGTCSSSSSAGTTRFFKLNSLTGRVMHLDASHGVSQTTNIVSAWQDQSNSGNNLLVLLGSPLLQTNQINSLPAIRLGQGTAMGRNFFTDLPTGDADRSLYFVVSYLSAGWGGFSYGAPQCLGAFGPTVTTQVGELFAETFCTNKVHQTGVVGYEQGWIVQSLVYKNQQLFHYKNDQLLSVRYVAHRTAVSVGTSDTLASGAQGRTRLGADHAGQAKIELSTAEILLFDHALDEMSHWAVVGELMGKYGLAG